MTLDEANSYVLPFGKHKGFKLIDVPTGYIEWLTTIDLRDNLKQAVNLVMVERSKDIVDDQLKAMNDWIFNDHRKKRKSPIIRNNMLDDLF